MKATAGWVGQVISWLVILVLLGVMAVCVVIPRVAGAEPYTILTGSMRPNYPPGTLMVVRPTSVDAIDVGDVITFQLEPGKPEVVTHRVIGEIRDFDGSTRFLTQGDANNAADEGSVRAVQIKGKLWYSAPALGRVNTVFSQGQHALITTLAGSALLLYAAFMIVSSVRDRRADKRRTQIEQDQASREEVSA